MRISKLSFASTSAAALLVVACARQGTSTQEQSAADGERIMRSMSDTLAHSQAFTFDTNERLEFATPDGGIRVFHLSRHVVVHRPNQLFFELHGRGDGPLDVTAQYDGQTVALTAHSRAMWAQAGAPNNLDAMFDDVAQRYGLPVPIADVAYSSPYDAFIGRETHGGIVGREAIDGMPCAKLDYADEFVDVKLWVPESGVALPRRLEIVYRQAPGQPVSRVDFTNWQLDTAVDEAMFDFHPPPGYTQVELRDLVAELLEARPAEQAKGS